MFAHLEEVYVIEKKKKKTVFGSTNVCVCIHNCVYGLHVCMCLSRLGSITVTQQLPILFSETMGLSLPVRLASEPRESSCLCLPSAGITNVPIFLDGFWGSNSGPFMLVQQVLFRLNNLPSHLAHMFIFPHLCAPCRLFGEAGLVRAVPVNLSTV